MTEAAPGTTPPGRGSWLRHRKRGKAARTPGRQAGPILEFSEGFQGSWTIGGGELAIDHRDGRWVIQWPGARRLDAVLDPRPGPIHRRWALPDRALLFRPPEPWRILPRSEQTLFLALPLWLRLEKDDGTVLGERPLQPLKPTFYGSNTRSGALCWSWRQAATVARQPHTDPPLASCRLVLKNPGDQEWRLPRLPLPAPGLTLYVDGQGALFTNDLIAERPAQDDQLPWPRVEPQPPADVGPLRVEAEARRATGAHLAKVFQDFLGY